MRTMGRLADWAWIGIALTEQLMARALSLWANGAIGLAVRLADHSVKIAGGLLTKREIERVTRTRRGDEGK